MNVPKYFLARSSRCSRCLSFSDVRRSSRGGFEWNSGFCELRCERFSLSCRRSLPQRPKCGGSTARGCVIDRSVGTTAVKGFQKVSRSSSSSFAKDQYERSYPKLRPPAVPGPVGPPNTGGRRRRRIISAKSGTNTSAALARIHSFGGTPGPCRTRSWKAATTA